MANNPTLVFAGNNRLRYLVTADESGGAFTIPNAGGASPDLTTDTLPGPLKAIATARVNGIGTVAAGALSQAQARALLLSDPTGASVGNNKVPRAICMVADRTAAAAMSVDANVDGDGDPIVIGTIAADGLGYVDIVAVGGVGISQ